MTRRPNPPSRYKATVRQTSHGGYGIVEIWHDEMLDRDVAIKWLASTAGEEQLLNEWRILATAVSRHVVEIYDLVFDRHGVLYGIVMEFIAGTTLEETPVPRNPGESLAVIRLLYQLATGLADLHSGDVVHRDVKPENAMIDAGMRLKICDFGLSSPPNTLTLRARATMGYRAPELYVPRPIVTFKSDVYSFGVVCWKVFTGGLPTVGPHGFPEQSNFPLASITTKAVLSQSLARVIDECVAWTPEDRPDMERVAKAFRNELTKGRHAGSLSLGSGLSLMNASNTKKKLGAGLNSIQVFYDEYDFRVEAVSGDVYVNNRQARIGDLLTEGCLLTFGGIGLRSGRAFAPFRQFTPEVVI